MGKALRVESACADAHANETATPGEQQKGQGFWPTKGKKKGKDSVDIRKRLVFYMARFPYRGD